MLHEFARDEWVKKHLPSVSADLKISFEVVMKQAYDAGYERGQQDTHRSVKAQQDEDLHGPQFI